MSEWYDVKIEITCVETEKLKKLEQVVWGIRRMAQLMLDICDDSVVVQYGRIGGSVTKVSE